MKYTRSEIISMENTLRKLQGMSDALLSRESTDAVNVRHLVALLAELRTCATLMASEGEDNFQARIGGRDRLIGLIPYNGKPFSDLTQLVLTDTPFANSFDKAALT